MRLNFLSVDMLFDWCVEHDDSAIQMIARKYELTGYTIPKVVFWNLHAADNVPLKFDQSGTALVSGGQSCNRQRILVR